MSNKLASLLIVDDNNDILDALANVVANYGHRVRTAANGFTALAEMKSELPDVLISDLEMPIMSGFELLMVVRSRFPEVGVIAMSGRYSGNEVPRGVAADAFYPKGGTANRHLPEMINEVAERSRPCPRR